MRPPPASAPTISSHAERRTLSPGEIAWLLLLPALALAVGVAVLAAHPLGRLLFDPAAARRQFFPSVRATLAPKPSTLACYLIAVVGALGFAALVALVARRPPRVRAVATTRRVLAIQCACAAGILFVWSEQRNAEVEATRRVYFTLPTVAVAVLIAIVASIALTRPRVLARLAAIPSGTRVRWGCALVALIATALWVLPAVYSDANIALAPDGITKHVEFTFDETMSVLNGRSPLVDMTVYGALIPYLVAPPLAALGATLGAFMTIMTALTAGALLAVYALLRRLTRHPVAALALYVPFLATSLFWVNGSFDARYDFGTYFAMFPIRYAGPYLLAWMLARHLDGARPRSSVALFTLAGLVVLNNADFGLPALGATLVALACTQPRWNARALVRLGLSATAGLATALAVVTALTLSRAGSLPHLELLFTFARTFGATGFSNLPTPLLGFHLVIYATFLAALVTAAARAARGSRRTALTGLLAWSGVFGLGTGAYYMYRSHPDVMIALFSSWTLALVLLAIAIAPAAARRPAPADVGVLLALGLAICSIAQLPTPWRQVERIRSHAPTRPLLWRDMQRLVEAHTRPGDSVALLIPLGHRVAYEAGVTNVTAYTGIDQMPTRWQFDETLSRLRREGGHTVFIGRAFWQEVIPLLRRHGYRLIDKDELSGYQVFAAMR